MFAVERLNEIKYCNEVTSWKQIFEIGDLFRNQQQFILIRHNTDKVQGKSNSKCIPVVVTRKTRIYSNWKLVQTALTIWVAE